jgi:opacity protein-like surface antigen
MRGPGMRHRRCILPTVLVVACWTASAQAQVVASPYVGTNFGDTEFRRGGPGIAVGYLGRWLGFELDIDRHHHFFKDEDVAHLVPNPGIDLDTDAIGFMGNLVAPVHFSGTTSWRPYGAAGLGVIHAWFDSVNDQYDTDQTNLAFNVGAGVMYWLNGWVGLRLDLRYFHAFVDDGERKGGYFEDYDFGRLSIGVTFGLPR